MSFRPTISVYFDGEIVDIGYYRNWTERGLVIECARYAAALDGCQTVEEVYRGLERMAQEAGAPEYPNDTDRVPYSDEDRAVVELMSPLDRTSRYPLDKDTLKSIEECSELPLVVDLDTRHIYACRGTLPLREVLALPEFEPYMLQSRYEDELYGILAHGRIPFKAMDLEAVRRL